jgi:hypothetical protein
VEWDSDDVAGIMRHLPEFFWLLSHRLNSVRCWAPWLECHGRH